jgi:hypothetical protein
MLCFDLLRVDFSKYRVRDQSILCSCQIAHKDKTELWSHLNQWIEIHLYKVLMSLIYKIVSHTSLVMLNN